MNGRPSNATHCGLQRCLEWLEACRKLGWNEVEMDSLEELFWTHRDKDGDLKEVKP